MKPPELIGTESLQLQPIQLSDAALMFKEYAQDPQVARYMSWPLAKNIEDTVSFVRSAIGWWENPEQAQDFVYSIRVTSSQQFIGCCSAGPHRPGMNFHWGIGYNLARRFWGQGYGTQVVCALAHVLMQRAEIHRVSAVVDIENIASARVLEKAGFIREGILRKYAVHPNLGSTPRDIFIYAKTRSDFKNSF
ncbi:MAG: GNAT family N-acetyltransferase [Oligoflexia bacterium]|nr:GNAT family N-acetyltransferase [Oligoflexia bacterium]